MKPDVVYSTQKLQKEYVAELEEQSIEVRPGLFGEVVSVSLVDIQSFFAPTIGEPFNRLENGGVRFHEHKMVISRPYPFTLRGIWLIAVRKSDQAGDVTFYKPE